MFTRRSHLHLPWKMNWLCATWLSKKAMCSLYNRYLPGGTHQQARALIDSGAMGEIIGETCHVLSHGMEHWHPNPDFFFQPGGGPITTGPGAVLNRQLDSFTRTGSLRNGPCQVFLKKSGRSPVSHALERRFRSPHRLRFMQRCSLSMVC